MRSSEARLGGCLVMLWLALAGCAPHAPREEVVFHSPVNTTDEVLTKNGVVADPISKDGDGAIRIETTQPTTVRLCELSGLPFESPRLIYRAKLRTEGVQGNVYLEMWCSLPGRGEFFSRALHAPLSGTTNWTTQETPFFFEKGQVPSTVKLNIVVEGPGKVWVDDIVLAKAVG